MCRDPSDVVELEAERILAGRTLVLGVAMDHRLVDWGGIEPMGDDALTVARRVLAHWRDELDANERAQRDLSRHQEFAGCN